MSVRVSNNHGVFLAQTGPIAYLLMEFKKAENNYGFFDVVQNLSEQ